MNQYSDYILLFVLATLAASLLVPIIKKIAWKYKILDTPSEARKIHTAPIPLMGGVVIFLVVAILTGAYFFYFRNDLNILPTRFFVGMLIGGLFLMVGGFLDEKYNLKPRYQFIFTLLAVLSIIFSGIGVGINVLSNPFGNPINLNWHLIGIPAGGIFTFIFVLGMIYTTKFLDGMDGLASGISFIASLTLFMLSLSPKVEQPVTAGIAIIFCGALLGFLFYNFNPASIFLGESGSTFLGYMLGVMSVLLGAKIATALLVMGLPVLDVAWVITRRIYYRRSIFQADRKHLHFRLLDIGFNQRDTVFILYALTLIAGIVALNLQARGKLFALAVLILVMIGLGLFTVMTYKRQHPGVDE